jgi:hydrogenase expression/formation protein HypE
VQAAADILGFDLMNIANEGKVLAIVSADAADRALDLWTAHPLGKKAARIGRVVETMDRPLAELRTKVGGRRIIQMPYGRELPRIC